MVHQATLQLAMSEGSVRNLPSNLSFGYADLAESLRTIRIPRPSSRPPRGRLRLSKKIFLEPDVRPYAYESGVVYAHTQEMGAR